ncbi:hypothetical protein [Niameybacter massiliensis]|uniref:hypothetical protein n=1 Tax=Niameybacter massiliensis TaxID=1658108 RepID=UPI0006B638E0|nr:hypothetical protein [Niameybacter massiliensis]
MSSDLETLANQNPNDPKLFNLLSENEKEILLKWIDDNFSPIQSFLTSKTSYGLKQTFDRTHFYVCNGVFKGAMLEAGYKVKNTDDINWIFNISKKSPYFSLK